MDKPIDMSDIIVDLHYRNLLSELGYTLPEHLRSVPSADLHREILRAHKRHQHKNEPPAREDVRKWCKIAREFFQNKNYDSLELEASIAPISIPVQESELVNADVNLDDIPLAQVASPDLAYNVCTEENLPNGSEISEALNTFLPIDSNTDHQSQKGSESDGIDFNKVASAKPTSEVSEMRRSPQKKGYTALRDPKAFSTFLAALVTCSVIISVLGAVVCTGLMILHPENKLLLLGVVLLSAFGVVYLLLAQQKRCCICHQKQFVRKSNMVNKKRAFKIPLLGYLFSMSLHAVLQGWFTCMFCGSHISLYSKGPKLKK